MKNLPYKILHRLNEAKKKREEAYSKGDIEKHIYWKSKVLAYKICLTLINAEKLKETKTK